MMHIIQKITIPLLSILLFSCALPQDVGQNQPSDNDPDVATWTKLSTNSPSMHSMNAMAYDTLYKKIINYGGRTGFPDFYDINETWAFDYNSST